jgi:hypothetical protein
VSAFIRLGALLTLTLASACTEPPLPPPTIRFLFDGPQCFGVYTVSFRIDSLWLGSYAYRIHLPPNDSVSRPYEVTPGQHSIGAQWSIFPGNEYVWPDSVMNFAPGDTHLRRLSIVCDLP